MCSPFKRVILSGPIAAKANLYPPTGHKRQLTQFVYEMSWVFGPASDTRNDEA